MLVEQWASLSAADASGTLSVAADGYYDVVVEYKHVLGTNYAQAATLSWEGASVAQEVIPSDRLYQAYPTLGSGAAIEVEGEAVDAALSRVTGGCLSLATAGTACSFAITLKDKFDLPVALEGGELLVLASSEDARQVASPFF